MTVRLKTMVKKSVSELSDKELEVYVRRLQLILARREQERQDQEHQTNARALEVAQFERNLNNLRRLLSRDKAKYQGNGGLGCKDVPGPGPHEHGGDNGPGGGGGGLAN